MGDAFEGTLVVALGRHQQPAQITGLRSLLVGDDGPDQAAAVDALEREVGSMPADRLAVAVRQLRLRLAENPSKRSIALFAPEDLNSLSGQLQHGFAIGRRLDLGEEPEARCSN